MSGLSLVLIFLLLWLRPGLLRWELVRDLEALLFLEMAILLSALFILPEQLRSSEEGLATTLLLVSAVVLAVTVGPLVGILLPIHCAARAGAVWRNDHPRQRATWTFVLSFAALSAAWMTVGLVWIDEGAWSASQVPRDLWWEVPSPHGARLAPHAVPVFGLVYFGLVAALEFCWAWRSRFTDAPLDLVSRTSA